MHEVAHQVAPSSSDLAADAIVLAARNVSQVFAGSGGAKVEALRGVDLELRRGEFLAIIGPSGSGKSTLLNILAGIEVPTSGAVWLRGHATTPRERLGQVGLMPQRDLLLPWRSALGNAIAGLEVRGVPRARAEAQAHDLFQRFGLAQFAHAYPATLSGGMRQRVALVRSALAAGSVLLLDEPFGALDALTRAELHIWLLELWGALGMTIALVTHDVNEALILADRVAILTARPGHVRDVLTIDLPRPHDAIAQASPAFGVLRRRLLEQLEAGL